MTTTNAVVVVRIDVGKSNLDAHILDSGIERRFDNSKTGHHTLRNWLFLHTVDHAAFEPTGRYHRNLHQSLFGAGIEASWPTRCAQAALPMPPANSPRSTASARSMPPRSALRCPGSAVT